MRKADAQLGVLAAAMGAAALWFSRDLATGTAARIGPGYFPVAIGAGLVVTGALLVLRGLRAPRDEMPPLNLSALIFVVASLVAFWAAIERLGLAVAIAGCIAVASLAAPERRWGQALVAIVLAVLVAWLVFVRTLGLPVRMLPW